MYRLMIIFHVAVSASFFLLAVGVTVRSVTGWTRRLKYKPADKAFSNALLIMLYLTLINGFLMYFILDPSLKGALDTDAAVKRASMRFWVVEHFYFMTFALVLMQIGSFFIRKTTVDKSRFMYASFYYGIATMITLVSMIFYIVNR